MAKGKGDNPLYGKFDTVLGAVLGKSPATKTLGSFWGKRTSLRYIDLFCGIGGFHQAAKELNLECVFACDIDADCRDAYKANYGISPKGDISQINPRDIPDHDLLFAGFPCQPFSIIGNREGFDDVRGTLFFEIARIIEAKKPKAFVLENVKQLASHNHGKTLTRILDVLKGMDYSVDRRILNALHFGLPQKRERVLIVGFLGDDAAGFTWPDNKMPMKPLSALLEKKPDRRYFVSERIRKARHSQHKAKIKPAIWHENKSGNISSHPFSCALRAGASYNYLLIDGERRPTPRELLRLQGFPDSFEIVGNDSQIRKQAGNSVPVPMVKAIIERVLNVQSKSKVKGKHEAA